MKNVLKDFKVNNWLNLPYNIELFYNIIFAGEKIEKVSKN